MCFFFAMNFVVVVVIFFAYLCSVTYSGIHAHSQCTFNDTMLCVASSPKDQSLSSMFRFGFDSLKRSRIEAIKKRPVCAGIAAASVAVAEAGWCFFFNSSLCYLLFCQQDLPSSTYIFIFISFAWAGRANWNGIARILWRAHLRLCWNSLVAFVCRFSGSANKVIIYVYLSWMHFLHQAIQTTNIAIQNRYNKSAMDANEWQRQHARETETESTTNK